MRWMFSMELIIQRVYNKNQIRMLPIIDYRNGRYQGELKNQMPDGVGIFMDKHFLFCLAEWDKGEVNGPTVIVFPSGRIFAGHIVHRQPCDFCTYELVQDHVKLIAFHHQSNKNTSNTIVGILPLLKLILEIDNSHPQEAKIIREHQYSVDREQDNIRSITSILGLHDRNRDGYLYQRDCLEFMQKYFAEKYQDILEWLINERGGRKQYFLGIRGEGLGIKISPLEDPGLNLKKTGRVYLVRGLGMFTSENQMKDIGLKTIDNAMKGVIMQQGNFSDPSSIIKYEIGNRPVNCLNNFASYLKRSLYFRDLIMQFRYLYELQRFVQGFNANLRLIQTEKLAQVTIERPNRTQTNFIEIDQKRQERQRQKQRYIKNKQILEDLGNPYSDHLVKPSNPSYNLQQAKDEIYRSVNKSKSGRNNFRVDYNNVEYIDPNYNKKNQMHQPPISKEFIGYNEYPHHEPYLQKDYQRRKTPNKSYSPYGKVYTRQPSDPSYPYNKYGSYGQRSYSPVRYQPYQDRGEDNAYQPENEDKHRYLYEDPPAYGNRAKQQPKYGPYESPTRYQAETYQPRYQYNTEQNYERGVSKSPSRYPIRRRLLGNNRYD